MADPRDVPTYTVAEAAHYVGMPHATLRTWLAPRGVIVPSKQPGGLSFWNLAEAWVLSSMRDHGVSMQRIRQAVDMVRDEMGFERPLIQAKFKSDGVDLFVEHLDNTVQASGRRRGQAYLRDLVQLYLDRVEYDEGRATSIYPFVRGLEEGAQHPRAVVISTSFGFGRPVIAGTGIRTDIVAGRYKAGESAAQLADDYSLSVEQIDDAIRAELREAA